MILIVDRFHNDTVIDRLNATALAISEPAGNSFSLQIRCSLILFLRFLSLSHSEYHARRQPTDLCYVV